MFFHKHHIVGGPWIFEYLYRMGRPLLSDAVYNSTIMYKKSDESYRRLHSDHFQGCNSIDIFLAQNQAQNLAQVMLC